MIRVGVRGSISRYPEFRLLTTLKGLSRHPGLATANFKTSRITLF